jgi:large repetitive protein
MFASSVSSRAKRRGIVLIVVLGMLALLALIGVTFATFSNQAQINARNFSQAASFPDAGEMLDYALSQLIEDTGNPSSVIRGHSFKRDMYGSDAGNNGSLLNGMPDGTPMIVKKAVMGTGAFGGMIQLTTNIPSTSLAVDNPFYNFDFTRWILRFPAATDQNYASVANPSTYVAQTHEVLVDDAVGDGTNRYLYIAVPSAALETAIGGTVLPKSPPPNDPLNNVAPMIKGYLSPDLPALIGTKTWSSNLNTLPPFLPSSTTLPQSTQFFVLDGRFLRAFNGPGVSGMNSLVIAGTAATGLDNALLANVFAGTLPIGHPLAEYGNFRYNGNIFTNVVTGFANPKATPTFTPTFGNPNNSNFIPDMDEDYDACDLENWFLALQSADGQVVVPSFHRPGVVSAFDWARSFNPNTFSTLSADQQLLVTRAMSRVLRPRTIDGHSPISFPDLIPDATGHISYDVDNDGDGVTDSVWLDLGYPPKRSPGSQIFKPLFAFMIIGLNGRLPLNTAGNLQQKRGTAPPQLLPAQAEHLGNSPSEIDMRFALQNAYDPINPTFYSQVDNAGVSALGDSPIPVSLTQQRNILAGARPYVANLSGDVNTVTVANKQVNLPNGIGDFGDGTNVQPADSPAGPHTTPYVLNATTPVAGRWGEEDAVPGIYYNALPFPSGGPLVYANKVRAGYSIDTAGTSYDARDDNFNSFGFNGETFDLYDGAGQISLPVARLRRFVNPIDLAGDGRVVTFNTLPGPFSGNGGDLFGRISFYSYFRPPGMPLATFGPAATTIPNEPAPLSAGVGAVWYDSTNFRYDVRTNNIYHGFTAALSPSAGASAVQKLQFAAMPNDIYLPTPPPVVNVAAIVQWNPAVTTPTYTSNINSKNNSDGINEADEMNLYTPTRLDAPFGPNDLEWLYRYQDVDGASLQSRLAQLAPISFLNPLDGSKRRRLFSLDTWETTNFVWANDNPQGTFASNSRFTAVANASFYNLDRGNVVNTSTTARPIPNSLLLAGLPSPVNVNTGLLPDPAADFSVGSNNAPTATSRQQYPVPTPSIAHRDRKINLNFPLPVSNSQIEPVRQKWIRETYELLKSILPPKAVDTPEELAALSQYVVNIVDFRDPDCTTTRFVNTDVIVHEPNTPTTPTMLEFATNHPPKIAYDFTYDPINTPTPPNLIVDPTTHYLVQHGMENLPVAINEVLAYQFQSKQFNTSNPAGDPLNDTPRMLLEMVNLLTKDALPDHPGVIAGDPAFDTSDLDLAGWEFVVLPDDGYGRPDPYTGQIPLVQPGLYVPPAVSAAGGVFPSISVTGGSAANYSLATPLPSPPVLRPEMNALLSPVASADNPALPQVYYYVLGNKPAVQVGAGGIPAEIVPPTPSTLITTPPPGPPATTDGYVDLTGMLYQRQTSAPTAPPAPQPGYYYWLYLRRPANPFDPTSEKVVVDSFRFLFTKSHGIGTNPGSGDTVTGNPITADYIFSLERLQPFRGGHAIPPLTATTGTTSVFVPAYGFSEQAEACQNVGSGTHGQYGNPPIQSTGTIMHTLGKKNFRLDQSWDYFPFNDRDFTSVVELLMVPGCSPGLFTKQFAELVPPILASYAGANAYAYTLPPPPAPGPLTSDATLWTTTAWKQGATPPLAPTQFAGNAAPHTFPYLNDEFFYTGSGEPVPAITPTVLITTPGWVANEPVPSAIAPWAGGPSYRSAYPDGFGNYNYVGGPSGAGWFKMFEFLEVPSTAFKAIGPAAQGINYDWARQDLKPGLLNINLIIDEEVFLGLMGESSYGNPFDPNSRGFMNQYQVGVAPIANTATPFIVTQIDDNGAPYTNPSVTSVGRYHMPNIGSYDTFTYTDPINGPLTLTGNNMKACFADFLNLRHGGTNNLFAWGNGAVGSFSTTGYPVDAERPFHALSYPDIDYTIMRPASLPPAVTNILPVLSDGTTHGYPWMTGVNMPDNGSTATTVTWDPGVKNPYLYVTSTAAGLTPRIVLQPPPIPARRLFQIPDYWGSPDNTTTTPSGGVSSNASVPGDPAVNVQRFGVNLINQFNDLTQLPLRNAGAWIMAGNKYLGGRYRGVATPPYDQRDHPYFRTEWLQKVTNLTTVRTHQYAVWITVGFFEVTRQGDPLLADKRPDLAYDILGLELGVLDGRNTRYRGFFLVDRTKAIGFNPNLPGDFRDCVAYRQLIE